MLPPALADLLAYHAPLSTLQRTAPDGTVTLLSPGTNVLALNASYVPEGVEADMDDLARWHEGYGLPPLLASTASPDGEVVARLRVGTLAGPPAGDGDIAVEQVSRLQLAAWADVLARAHGTAGWGANLARHLGARLEDVRDAVLLLAYRNGEGVGALLWRDRSAHLWGVTDVDATSPLLRAAFDLSGGLRLSVPDGLDVALLDPYEVLFTRPALRVPAGVRAASGTPGP